LESFAQQPVGIPVQFEVRHIALTRQQYCSPAILLNHGRLAGDCLGDQLLRVRF
jgi:hypothetical protein